MQSGPDKETNISSFRTKIVIEYFICRENQCIFLWALSCY